jgi:glycosyltransferase involved in cell wall biosynthesis
MNIVLINSIGKNKWGGGEKWMIMAASGLLSVGHNVVAVCRKNSKLVRKAKAENIPVKEIGANSDFDVIACFKFCRFFKSYKPDVIIGCQNKDWRVASMAVKLTGSKAKVYSRQGLQLLKNNWWYKWTIRLFSDGIITNTNTIKEYYDSFLPVGKDFVKVVFNGVEEIPDNIEAFDYSKYLPKEEKNPVIILSTGRLARQKGFKFLIDAAKKIIDSHPNVYFFLAGQGKLETYLKNQIQIAGIEKNFILLGFFDDIHPLLKTADIFVFPSLYEGMPNSILEAMAHGLPVISTNVNGVKELISEGINGYTVEPGTSTTIYKALDHLLNNRENIKEIGENARDFVLKNFAVDRMVTNLNNLITENVDS